MNQTPHSLFLLVALIACGGDVAGTVADLESSNPTLREDAAVAARDLDDPKIVAALERAIDDPDPRIRAAVIRSLFELASPSSVPPLARHVSDPDPLVARLAVTALGHFGGSAGAPALVEALKASPEKPRLDILWALGECQAVDAKPLLAALRQSTDPWVRFNADTALRKLGP